MYKVRFLLQALLLIPVLGCCTPKGPETPEQKTDPDPVADPEEEVAEWVVKAVPGWDSSLDGTGLGFAAGDQIGVYCLNTSGTSYYNVAFRTEDGETFSPVGGRTLNFDEDTEIYAYFPYAKDATRTLIKDVQIPLRQDFSCSLHDGLFFTAKGNIRDGEAVLTFIPVQSVVKIVVHNQCGKDLTLNGISLEFAAAAAGIFRHDLQNDPSSADFSLSPMTGTTATKIEYAMETPVTLPSGGTLSCRTVVAPMQSATVSFRGDAGEGESWTSAVTLDGNPVLRPGVLKVLDCTMGPENYDLDIYSLIESMNLLENGDYKVPEKYKSRMRTVNGVENVRDFGGIALEDGGTTATGVLFRSAALEGIKEDGRVYMTQTLGIRTDIDLRDPDTGEAKGYTPLGEGVTYFNRLGPWYVYGGDGIKEGGKRANLLEILQMFVAKKNYPLLFHCQVGRDRTGTLGAILAGLAGATRKAFYEDYLVSFYANCCHSGGYYAAKMAPDIVQLYEFLSTYKSADLGLSANTEAFLLDLGMTSEQVDILKDILLTGDITVQDTTGPGLTGGSIENIASSPLE